MSEEFYWKDLASLHMEIQDIVAQWASRDGRDHEVLCEIVRRFSGVSMWEGVNYEPTHPERRRMEEALEWCQAAKQFQPFRRAPDSIPPKLVAKRLGLSKLLEEALCYLWAGQFTHAAMCIQTRLRELDDIETRVASMGARQPRAFASPERQEASRKAVYDMPDGMYAAMLAKQGGVCRGCRVPPIPGVSMLYVDHSHRTGRVRALLCDRCNRALGLARDNAVTLRNLADLMDEDEDLS